MVGVAVEPHQRNACRRDHHRGRRARRARTLGRIVGRPRQCGPVGLRRIGGGEHHQRTLAGVGRLALGTQTVDRARQRELGGAEPGDEVAAPRPAALFEHLQHAVDRGVATDDTLGEDRLAGDHPVPFEQLQGLGVGGLGGGRRRLQERRHEAPAAGSGRRAEPRQPPGPRPLAGAAGALLRPRRDPAGEDGPERGQRVVGDLARPHEIPQRARAPPARWRPGRHPAPDPRSSPRSRPARCGSPRADGRQSDRAAPSRVPAARSGRRSTGAPAHHAGRSIRHRARPPRRSCTTRRASPTGIRRRGPGADRARSSTPPAERPPAPRWRRSVLRDRGAWRRCRARQAGTAPAPRVRPARSRGATWPASAVAVGATRRGRTTRAAPRRGGTRPAPGARRRPAPAIAPSTRSSGAPNRRATSLARNGPCVRAKRATSSSSGRGTGSVKAVGRPIGSEQPSASR